MGKTQPYTVLAVDDNLLNLKLIERSLFKEGYQIFIADNGPDARSIALEKRPDLILLDIEMPGENGFDVIKKLKDEAATNSLIQDQAAKLRQVTKAQSAMLPLPEENPHAKFGVYYNALHEAGVIFTIF